MNAARLSESDRLQRTLDALRANPLGLTTMEIIRTAGVCAVNSIVSELRANGIPVSCKAEPGKRGVYRYRIAEAA